MMSLPRPIRRAHVVIVAALTLLIADCTTVVVAQPALAPSSRESGGSREGTGGFTQWCPEIGPCWIRNDGPLSDFSSAAGGSVPTFGGGGGWQKTRRQELPVVLQSGDAEHRTVVQAGRLPVPPLEFFVAFPSSFDDAQAPVVHIVEVEHATGVPRHRVSCYERFVTSKGFTMSCSLNVDAPTSSSSTSGDTLPGDSSWWGKLFGGSSDASRSMPPSAANGVGVGTGAVPTPQDVMLRVRWVAYDYRQMKKERKELYRLRDSVSDLERRLEQATSRLALHEKHVHDEITTLRSAPPEIISVDRQGAIVVRLRDAVIVCFVCVVVGARATWPTAPLSATFIGAFVSAFIVPARLLPWVINAIAKTYIKDAPPIRFE